MVLPDNFPAESNMDGDVKVRDCEIFLEIGTADQIEVDIWCEIAKIIRKKYPKAQECTYIMGREVAGWFIGMATEGEDEELAALLASDFPDYTFITKTLCNEHLRIGYYRENMYAEQYYIPNHRPPEAKQWRENDVCDYL